MLAPEGSTDAARKSCGRSAPEHNQATQIVKTAAMLYFFSGHKQHCPDTYRQMDELETDSDLLTKFRCRNDRAALDRLIRRYVDFVYATSLRELGGDAHRADDVTQATFMLFTCRASSVPAHKIGGWLFRVTRYCAANVRRGDRRRKQHESNAANERQEALLMPTDQNLSVESDAASVLPALNDAIASLSSADRELIVRRYLCNGQVEVIASDLGKPETTIRKRLSRAVAKLRSRLASRGLPAVTVGTLTSTMLLTTSTKASASTIAGVSALALGASVSASATITGISAGAAKMMFASKIGRAHV